MEIGSEEEAAWFEQRLGNVTASRISDLMAKTKSGYSTSRMNYMSQLVVERLTGTREESYTSAAMQWGIETEAQAREVYEGLTGTLVFDAGFVLHPTIERSGASPDGLVGKEGLLEIKCPNTATHIKTLLGSTIDRKYLLQMQWQMACTDRQWADFVSFDPRMPEGLKIMCERVERDTALIQEIETEIVSFLAELETQTEALNKLREL